jgi:hypothetical protein
MRCVALEPRAMVEAFLNIRWDLVMREPAKRVPSRVPPARKAKHDLVTKGNRGRLDQQAFQSRRQHGEHQGHGS